MAQELASIDQKTLLLVLLDLCKAYNNIYRESLMMTLEVYSAVSLMFRLLTVFWDQKQVINRQNGYPSPHFKVSLETTQGRLISPTLFNYLSTIW